MYTEPKIFTSNDLKTRSYIIFYFYGKRIRIYNGHSLGKKINPNYAGTIKDRNRLLEQLQFELKTALTNNSYPVIQEQPTENKVVQVSSTQEVLRAVLDKKLNSGLSKFYKRNLKYIHKLFIDFLTEDELKADLNTIGLNRIEEFLSRFNSSGTYYMDKRRDLGVLFSSASKSLQMDLKAVKNTEPRMTKAILHKVYEKAKMKKILEFLKQHNPNLHICCLLSYGCFLRPHQEIRKLSGNHFKQDTTEIHLSGSENKGRKVRVVYIPDYVREAIITRLQNISPNTNLFSLKQEPFNDAYFNTAWSRAWKKMNEAGLIEKNQTIYSFRHTAAVDVYRRTKDVYLLQKLLGHSTIVVTLKYLRGLGEFNMEELRDAAPKL